MRKLLFFLSLSISYVSFAQTTIPDPKVRPTATVYPQRGVPIACGGPANNVSVDLNWMPVLSKKRLEQEHESVPGLEEIKEAKNELKKRSAAGAATPMGKTTAVTPMLGMNFAGYTPMSGTPLDNSVAVSNGGVVVNVENSQMSYYNSTTGALLFHNSFVSVLPYTGIHDVCDPVVLYDPGADRFIFFVQEIGSWGLFANNRVFLGFSRSNNPNVDGWWCYAFTGDPTGYGDGFDYPKLAINDSELFLTGNLFYQPSNAFHQAMLFQLDKRAGYAGGSMNYVYYPSIPGAPFTLLPVSAGQGANITTGMVLVSTHPTGGSDINVYKITGNLCCAPAMNAYSVPVLPYTPPGDAYQLGTTVTLKTGDCRALSGFYLNGIIHFVFNTEAGGGYTGIDYNRLNFPTLTNTSTVFSMSGFDCAYPAVASFASDASDQSVMIGFGRSGSTIAPEIRAVSCDAYMSWSPSTLVKSLSYATSTDPYINRWGDYTGISRKHNSTTPTVWMNGAYGNSGHIWATWISEINATGASCITPTGLSVSSVTATSAVLNWGPVAGAASYNVQYRKVGVTPWTTTTATTNTKTLTGLLAATNYEFQVQTACSGTATSGYSTSMTFTQHSVGVANVGQNDDVRVFPNPVVSSFSLEFPLDEDAALNIKIVDMSGEVIKELYDGRGTVGTNVFSFNKANLAAGNYILVVNANGENVKSEKVVVSD